MSDKSFVVAGARFDAQAMVGDSKVILNGYGLRRILFVNAYAIGLYLQTKQKTNEEIFAAPGAKRLRLVLLRKLTADQLADVIDSGVSKNIGAKEYQALVPRLKDLRSTILGMGAATSGVAIHLDWLPGKAKDPGKGGTRLSLDGETIGKDIPGEDFFHAILKVWLGDNINDSKLRDALQGHST